MRGIEHLVSEGQLARIEELLELQGLSIRTLTFLEEQPAFQKARRKLCRVARKLLTTPTEQPPRRARLPHPSTPPRARKQRKAG